MVRVVIDTNVFVSGLLKSDNPPSNVVDLFIEDKINLIISEEVFSEYIKVLLRPELKVKKDNIIRLISIFILKAEIIKVKTKLDIIERDPSDNKFLECALDGKVDYIITGDKHLLELKKYKKIKIVDPKTFINIF